jgi:hypothetical protein
VRLLKFITTGRFPSKSGGVTYRRLQRHLLRPVFTNVVVNNIVPATSIAATSTTDHLLMLDVACAMLLFRSSSMLELCMLITVLGMNYLLELITNLPKFQATAASLGIGEMGAA